MRSEENLGRESSVVKVRRLDEISWRVASYDVSSGEFDLVRDSVSLNVSVPTDMESPAEEEPNLSIADQFDAGSDDPSRTVRVISLIGRDPAVRRTVLTRSRGVCEFCNAPGFRMADGRLYLETHHVVPLADGGADRAWNVAALCPNDHREAHFGERSEAIRRDLLQLLAAYRRPVDA
jgi:5-methylcytosine-specific restriction protein A